MRVIGIIQARMGSNRLPNKVMSPLGKTNLLDYVYRRSLNVPLIDEVVIATTTNKEDDAIEQWANKNGINLYRGSENNLLNRFTSCAKIYHADYVVRITGDCPFICFDLSNELIKQTLFDGAEYGFVCSENIPIGLKVSMIKTELLFNLDKNINHQTYREHITLYIDEHLEKFKTTSIEPFDFMKNKDYRLTCDTQEDYQFFKTVVSKVGNDVLISSEDIIDFLDNNPQIAAINNSIKQKKFFVNREF